MFWLCGSAMLASETPQMLPRRPIEPAVLVRDGQTAASIVCPADPQYLELGQRIADSVRQLTGAQLPVLADTQVVPQEHGAPKDAYQHQTLVLLGSLNSNRAVLPLYAKYYVACDRQYPGGDGYVLQTVWDPYGVGAPQILLGGSSLAGVQRAVAAFLSTLAAAGQQHTLTVPRLLTVVPGGEFKSTFDVTVAQARSSARPSADFCVDAMNYLWTGEPQLLRRATAAVRRLDFKHPQGGPWSDYELEAAVRGFNALDDAGAFSAEKLQAVDNLLLRYAQAHANAYWRSKRPADFGQRHQTMGTLAFYTLTKYLLLRGNPNAEARAQLERWRDECRSFLHAFAGTYRDDNDDNGSLQSAEPLLRYVMEDQDFEFFRSGMARKVAARAMLVTDNRGWGAGMGNYEECRPGYVRFPNSSGAAIGLAAFYYGDGGYRWLLQRAPGVQRPGHGWAFSSGIAGGRYPLSSDIPAQQPKSLLGVQALMLDQYHYRRSGYYMAHGPFAAPAERPWYIEVPEARAVDKLCFRDRFQRDGQYLLLQGVQGGRYSSMDANAIVRLMDRGHLWLLQNTQQWGPAYKNAVSVGHGADPDAFAVPGCVRLDALADDPVVGLTATTLPRYHGTDWTRAVAWRKGAYFLVFDLLQFREDGPYSATWTWRLPYPAALDHDTLVCRQGDDLFRLIPSSPVRQWAGLEDDPPQQWRAVRPYLLKQYWSGSGKRSQIIGCQNLLCVSGVREGQPWQARRISDQCCLIAGLKQDDSREVALALCNPRGDSMSAAGFETNAVVLLADASGVHAAGDGVFVRYGGRDLDLHGGRAELPATAAARLQELWKSAGAAAPAAPAADTPSLDTQWKFADFYCPLRRLDGVDVSCSTAMEHGPIEALVDRQTPLWGSGLKLPARSEVTFDLRQVEELKSTRLVLGHPGQAGFGKLPNRASLKGSKPRTFVLSNDSFRTDVRSVKAEPQPNWCVFDPPVYKDLLVAWRTDTYRLGQPARFVRTSSEGIGAQVEFYAQDRTLPTVTMLQAADLDGNGREELVVATDAHEVVGLSSEGKRLFAYQADAAITGLLCEDVDADRRREILLTTVAGQLVCLQADGKLRFVAMQASEPNGEASTATAVGVWRPDKAGRRRILVAGGGKLLSFTADGKLEGQAGEYGATGMAILHPACDLNGDGIEDTAVHGDWGTLCVADGATFLSGGRQQKPQPAASAINWSWPLGLLPWRAATTERPQLLLITEMGTALYDPLSGKRLWQVPGGTVAAYAWADLEGSGRSQLLLAKREGFVEVVDPDGTVQASWPIGEPIRDMAVWPHDGQTRVALAIPFGLVILNDNGVATHRVPGDYQRVAVVRAGKESFLVGATAGGLIAFR